RPGARGVERRGHVETHDHAAPGGDEVEVAAVEHAPVAAPRDGVVDAREIERRPGAPGDEIGAGVEARGYAPARGTGGGREARGATRREVDVLPVEDGPGVGVAPAPDVRLDARRVEGLERGAVELSNLRVVTDDQAVLPGRVVDVAAVKRGPSK